MKISTPVFYSKRNLGIDLLRIVSMMMIICLHTLGRSDLLTAIEESSGKYAFVWLIEILSYCAVDCFILISGYVGAHSDFRLSRILSIYIQVIFYNVLFALIYQIMGDDFQIIRTLKSFMPLTTKAYWFFNCYFILSIFMPFINELVKNLTYHQRILLALLLLIIFSIAPMLICSPLPIVGNQEIEYISTKQGYSAWWFIIMYILGAILRWNVDEGHIRIYLKRNYILLYSACVFVTWLIWCINNCWLSIGKAWFVVSYTAPLIVVAGFSLFLFFLNLYISPKFERIIQILSGSAFSVYLIHSNKWVYGTYVKAVKPLINFSVFQLAVTLPLIIIGVYLGCTIIDLIRLYFFKSIEVYLKKLDKCIIVKWLHE